MKTLILAFIFSCLIVSVQGHGSDDEKDWVFTQSDNGVSHYERWVTVNSELKVRERKVEMEIRGNFDKAVHFLADQTNCKQWMRGVKMVDGVYVASNGVVSHTIMNLPWPFKDQDMVALCELELLSRSSVRIKITSWPNAFPSNSKCIRIKDYQASWELTRISNDKIKIVFWVIARDAPRFPRVIQDPIVKKIFRENFNDLKTILSSL